ncbi:hypothetical protein BDA96_04G078100 [Sorghum bicolor]|uniref:Uncharacterized protein n=1 Tax=Sorghum bicolor TaxID=4558 RepID=A0A921UJH9_SORBI|nr:hypothetical protein BDA96_04G078100 [Sorghum bicolor]
MVDGASDIGEVQSDHQMMYFKFTCMKVNPQGLIEPRQYHFLPPLYVNIHKKRGLQCLLPKVRSVVVKLLPPLISNLYCF